MGQIWINFRTTRMKIAKGQLIKAGKIKVNKVNFKVEIKR